MKNNKALRKLALILDAIEEDGCGLSWAPYRDACQSYGRHGQDMSAVHARYHIQAIVTRWKQEGCDLPARCYPISL